MHCTYNMLLNVTVVMYVLHENNYIENIVIVTHLYESLYIQAETTQIHMT